MSSDTFPFPTPEQAATLLQPEELWQDHRTLREMRIALGKPYPWPSPGQGWIVPFKVNEKIDWVAGSSPLHATKLALQRLFRRLRDCAPVGEVRR